MNNYSRLGKPVDREEWHMYPQTVNAYYSPLVNEICFPAGILQPPYFDPERRPELNYGAIGVVIGHEMTHGFDDQGRQFDTHGNLANWWTADDAKRFNALADKLVAQFDAIEVAPGTHANGRFTLGENIADQGGLRIAWTAWRNRSGLSDNEAFAPVDAENNIENPDDSKFGADAPSVPNTFSPAQRFYLSYAQLWAGNIRPEEILVRVKTDPHSLERDRVNATLKNIDTFMRAFNLKSDDPMFSPAQDRVIIW